MYKLLEDFYKYGFVIIKDTPRLNNYMADTTQTIQGFYTQAQAKDFARNNLSNSLFKSYLNTLDQSMKT